MKPFKQPVSVLVVIHTLDGRVLLLERADRPGFWQSVTGSREGDEALIDTARREVFEETGIQAALPALSDWDITNRYEIYDHWRHRYAPGVTHNDEHVFGLALPDEVPVRLSPGEHLAWCWLPWQEAALRVFSPSNAEALRLLPARLT
ncbi:MAG: dihydroneopterin triphosphate diphosphatase [Paludibacterium sp.]|uniref:dihydroneopterin triphosphate diphosphatase n=1 Tax=Paludibacterium sp. TaxID=1917523 RepID=UPI0025DD9E5A|nr:dihydroneopterin triphosphate diphosphatase [Paludibacterium sp.]MBV8048415.1 dihydroneopterin triphosphate diphosphatase [Paludibacterium sp.]MBV8646901.1 dihydroneopterin triphosphate diphosphatase [Paludibacterium sp.]